MRAINKKSGEKYIILQEDILNVTNEDADDMMLMVLYVKELEASLDDSQLYCREKDEFNEKFERI
jgi:hypothetical protein